MPIKSMQVFFIDNQASFGANAKLVGDMVVWPDSGKYPTFVPVCIASHPDYDGRVGVMAGNRGLVLTFVSKARNVEDIKQALAKNKGVEQYRIALDGIIHRMVMHMHGDRTEEDRGNAVQILAALVRSCPEEAGVMMRALRSRMKSADGCKFEDVSNPDKEWQNVDELLQVMEAAMAENHG